jgi:hypothetical protein
MEARVPGSRTSGHFLTRIHPGSINPLSVTPLAYFFCFA